MKIEIELEEYIQLMRDSLELNYLEAGGVDNWQQYSEALYPSWGDGSDFDEEAEEMEQRIREKYGE